MTKTALSICLFGFLLLTGCTIETSITQESWDSTMSLYKAGKDHKALAYGVILENGKFESAKSVGYSTTDIAVRHALDACKSITHSDCKIVAIDDRMIISREDLTYTDWERYKQLHPDPDE